jgi:hypothetical protein
MVGFSNSFSADLIDYQVLGRIIQHQGIIGYLTSGPHREPLYPLICAGMMKWESISGVSFTHLMAGFGILMMLLTQIFLYVILQALNVRSWISSLGLLYWGLSPAINNSAFHVLLFCEIVTYPLMLAAVIAGWKGWEAVSQNNNKTAGLWGSLSGLMLALLTFVKAPFECIAPAYFLVFLTAAAFKKRMSFALLCFLAAAGLMFYGPVLTYKCLNQIYNGNFCLADRGPMNLYGNVERRIQPLTLRKYAADLASIGGVCGSFFKPEECSFWTYEESDSLGGQKMGELTNQHLPPQQVTNIILRLSKEKAMSHWSQYGLLTITEGLKMFFWEAPSSGVPLNFIAAWLTFLAWCYCLFNLKHLPNIMGQMVLIVFLFVFFYAFFAILPRHMLPLVPFYLIMMGYSFNSILCQKRKSVIY